LPAFVGEAGEKFPERLQGLTWKHAAQDLAKAKGSEQAANARHYQQAKGCGVVARRKAMGLVHA